MRKRPDIVISVSPIGIVMKFVLSNEQTKHTYEIAYKYEWKCQNSECGYV